MTETPGSKQDARLSNEKNLSTAPLTTVQVRALVEDAIANLHARGIEDWQIHSAWSELAHQQGNYARADTLASAAYELGKPVE